MILLKTIRIKSLILRSIDETPKEEITVEESEKAPRIPKKEKDEEHAAMHIPSMRIETDTDIVEMHVSEKNYGNLCHVFILYRIPLKLIKNGIEIDIRDKEPYPYRDHPPK